MLDLRRPAQARWPGAGKVELRRRRFRCLDCGTEFTPLDAALGFEARTQHTLGLDERALRLVTEMSYQMAVDSAVEQRGRPIGRRSPVCETWRPNHA